jgi:hypothetical protein
MYFTIGCMIKMETKIILEGVITNGNKHLGTF